LSKPRKVREAKTVAFVDGASSGVYRYRVSPELVDGSLGRAVEQKSESREAMMHHFEYHNGEMFAEGVPLKKIAKEIGTPTYVIIWRRCLRVSMERLQRTTYRVFR
jgi:hypothetical protein